MPNAVVKAYAKQTGKSVEHVERWWKEAEEQASKKFDKKDDSYWAYVNGIVERRGKLKHGKRKRKHVKEGLKLTFKQYMAETKDMPMDVAGVENLIDEFVSYAIENDFHEVARESEDGVDYLYGKFSQWLEQQKDFTDAQVDAWLDAHGDDAAEHFEAGLT